MQLSKMRHRFRVAPDDPGVFQKGPVQKLVLKSGWENRKWNDRWIELLKGEFRYCWREGSPIDCISASAISGIKIWQDENRFNEPQDCAGALQETNLTSSAENIKSIWPKITAAGADQADELQNGFLIQTVSGEHAGREYFFRTSSQEEALSWIASIKTMLKDAQPKPNTAYVTVRRITRCAFESMGFTIITTMLILLNFSAFVYDTQVFSRVCNRARA